jgi:hypothetical protein
MNNHFYADKDRTLREQLCEEALETRPAFSAALHNKIMAAIERPAAEKPRFLAKTEHSRSSGLGIALTAACLLAAVALGWPKNASEEVTTPTQEMARVKTDANLWKQDERFHDLIPAAGSSTIPAVAATTTTAGLSMLDELAGGVILGLIDADAAAPSTASALKHDTKLAAETLLLRLPMGIEFLPHDDSQGM